MFYITAFIGRNKRVNGRMQYERFTGMGLWELKKAHSTITIQNWTHVDRKGFDHKDLRNHLLQRCPKLMIHRIHKSSKCILHNGTSSSSVPLFHNLGGPTSGTPCIGSYHAFLPICSLQNQLGLRSATLSGKASLRFLVRHETLFSSCTLWGVLVRTVVAVVFLVLSPLRLGRGDISSTFL
jgi:hypothetical protein